MSSIQFSKPYEYYPSGAVAKGSIAAYDYSEDDAESVIVTYIDGDDGNDGASVVGIVSGTLVSFGSGYDYTGDNTAENHVDTRVGTSGQVVLSRNEDSHGAPYVTAGSVSGSSGTLLSWGTAATPDATATVYYIDIVSLSSSYFAVSYIDTNASNACYVAVGEIDATGAITFGTEVKVANNAAEVVMTRISDFKFAIAYRDVADSNRGKCKLGSVFGTFINLGSAVEFKGGSGATFIGIEALTILKFVVVYKDIGDSNKLKARTALVSGTSCTFQTETELYP